MRALMSMLSEDKRKVGVSNKKRGSLCHRSNDIALKSIAARIEDLSREIATEFSGTNKLIVVGLRGSFVFIADLRELTRLLRSISLRRPLMAIAWKVRARCVF